MQIALLGDVMLGRLVNQHLATVRPAYPWGDTLELLRQAAECCDRIAVAIIKLDDQVFAPVAALSEEVRQVLRLHGS